MKYQEECAPLSIWRTAGRVTDRGLENRGVGKGSSQCCWGAGREKGAGQKTGGGQKWTYEQWNKVRLQLDTGRTSFRAEPAKSCTSCQMGKELLVIGGIQPLENVIKGIPALGRGRNQVTPGLHEGWEES